MGRPETAPFPAAAATPFSVVPVGVLVPVDVVPDAAPPVLAPVLPPAPPSSPLKIPRADIPLLTVAAFAGVALPVVDPDVVAPVEPDAAPMNVEIADAASTAPNPLVLPRGGPLARMIEVSFYSTISIHAAIYTDDG